MVFEFQIYQRHEEQYGNTYAHTHIVLARVQYEENRPVHLVLHTRDKQLKSAPHAGHQSRCCHICSGSTVSKGPEDRPKKISHWPQCNVTPSSSGICQGMSWKHVHQPVAGKVYTPLSLSSHVGVGLYNHRLGVTLVVTHQWLLLVRFLHAVKLQLHVASLFQGKPNYRNIVPANTDGLYCSPQPRLYRSSML